MIPQEVTRLQRMIRETRAGGVVLLSGDRHSAGFYRTPGGDATDSAPYDLYEVTSSSLTHSFRLRADEEDEVDPLRIGRAIHENNFGTVSIDWAKRLITLRLLTSDDCGVSPQEWHRPCLAHNDVSGRDLANLTISIDDLQPRDEQR